MKQLIKKILKEQVESNEERFIQFILSKLKAPYFKNLNNLGVKRNEIKKILTLVFNQLIKIKNKNVYDERGNEIYHENSDGSWEKRKYDERGNEIYYENFNGQSSKSEYDEMNNEIYYEDSDGYWAKYEYDERGNEIYYENSDGQWLKSGYDENDDIIYQETDEGILLNKK